MNKIMIATVLSLALSGCMWQTVTPYDIVAAQETCKENKTYLVKVFKYFDGRLEVMCKDKTIYENVADKSNDLYIKNLEDIK